MRDQRLAFKCYHEECRDDEPLGLIVQVQDIPLLSTGSKETLRYCRSGGTPT